MEVAHAIADSRCDDCSILYGTFREMEDSFREVGGTYDDFKLMLEKCEYKKPFFDAEVEKVKEEKRQLIEAELLKNK